MTLLEKIDSSGDLKQLPPAELSLVATEVREFLIEHVTQTGGHLGASLGTVELAIALHYYFDTPRDLLVWDVGHQAYTHKLLTGRRDRFSTLRQEGGISGFLSRDESVYDTFGAGHASTAISAALGMAVASHLKEEQPPRRVVAVVGDGALTGGMSYEGLNNAGDLGVPLLVILNDNEMSIDRNVGAISKYLDNIRTDRRYYRAKDDVQSIMEKLPQGDLLIEIGKRWKDSLKEFIYHRMIWEELGFTYLGPVPGHDFRALFEAFQQASAVHGPVFLHVVTEKGKGYGPAENDRERGHAVAAKSTRASSDPAPPRYQDVFAATLIELATNDPRLVGITAAMPSGTSMGKFQKAFPHRYFDTGIAEQHAVTFAAGLATQGMKPVCAIYSTFLQRAYDQILHDVCLQRLPVVFALDRAGFAGDDGRTHHGLYDLSYLRCLPNITIMAPKDENELRGMLACGIANDAGPTAIRYPRGIGPGASISGPIPFIPIGKAEVLRSASELAILAVGAMVSTAEQAAELLQAEGFNYTVVNARFVKPLDEVLILELARTHKAIITVEENVAAGGFGAAVLTLLSDHGVTTPVSVIAVPDRVFEQATQARLREMAGLTPIAIAAKARALLGAMRSAPAVTASLS